MKKTFYKRCHFYLKKKNFKIKFLRSSKKHLLVNKSKFSKKYLKNRFYFFNKSAFKKFLF